MIILTLVILLSLIVYLLWDNVRLIYAKEKAVSELEASKHANRELIKQMQRQGAEYRSLHIGE